MRKATIFGLLALLTVAAALFAAPALSTSSSQEVTIKSLARQVRVLRGQVNTLRRQVAAARTAARNAQLSANSVQRLASSTEQMAISTQATVQRIDGCLSRALPLTRYGDVVGSDAVSMFTVFDPDVQGSVPVIRSAGSTFGFTTALDVTNAGDSVSYHVAIVESSCTGGYRVARQPEAVAR